MKAKHILFSVNSSWNVINFRKGVVSNFVKNGYQVTVIAPRDEYSDQIVKLGAEYVELPMEQQGKSLMQDLGLFWRYLSVFKRLKPDVYVSYTIKPNIYGSLAARCFGVPTVNNVAGLGNIFIRGGLLQNMVKRLYALALSRASCVFFQNPDDKRQFVYERLVTESQAELLPGSGVNLDEFQGVDYVGRDGKEMEFLFVGRLLKDKGILELVEAARVVKKDYPLVKVKLLGFVGVANPSAISQKEVDVWVDEGVIEYLGASDDVRPYLQRADCVILPTAYKEGTPRSLIEAGAIGVPLIATDVSGCREIVDHGVNGYLCEAKNTQSIVLTMIKMIELPGNERMAMANASRAKVVEEYDEKIVIQKYLKAVGECS